MRELRGYACSNYIFFSPFHKSGQSAFFLHRENLSSASVNTETQNVAIMNVFWENQRQVKVQPLSLLRRALLQINE